MVLVIECSCTPPKQLLYPLTKLFSLSLKQCRYLSLWKIAHFMPLFKKGNKSNISSYKLVSLSSCTGKCFERVVHKNLYNHILENSLLYKYQSGLIPGHLTVHHLIAVVHQTCRALENCDTSCHSFFFFCDISKAFGRLWHTGLLIKLEVYGLPGDTLKWFKNYLKDRSQKVIINGEMSS